MMICKKVEAKVEVKIALNPGIPSAVTSTLTFRGTQMRP